MEQRNFRSENQSAEILDKFLLDNFKTYDKIINGEIISREDFKIIFEKPSETTC